MASSNEQNPEPTPRDSDLMVRMATDTPDSVRAFDILLDRYERGVYAFALRFAPTQACAEDITQETFLRLWRARYTYRPLGATLRTYLFTIARRLCCDRAKRQTVEIVPFWEETDDAGFRFPTLPGPEHALLVRELATVLDTALNELPPVLGEAVYLRDTEAMPYEQIAAVLGCPIGTAKSRVAAARVRLRAVLARYLQEKP